MSKREKRSIKELSLLENPNKETQVKDSSWRVIFRIIAISILFILIICGYAIKFSVSEFPTLFSTSFTGTFNASNFYGAKDYDLIIARPYKNISDVEIGDVVCFATNLEKGSGVVVDIQSSMFEIDNNGELKRVSVNSIVGKQVKTVSVLGFFVEFIGSYYGIITFNVLLLAYVVYLTFSRINYENTENGLILYKKFRINQKEKKERLKLLKKLKGIDGITYEVASIVDGNFNQNKQKLINFDNNIKSSLKEKYKFILNSIHDAYLTKDSLDRQERKHITSVVELMCVAKDMDNDIEYMIVDLLLKTNLVDFDAKSFSESAIEFLNSSLDDDDLLNFGSVLYIMAYKNKKNREDLKELSNFFLQKAQYLDRKDKDLVFGTALTIAGLIK